MKKHAILFALAATLFSTNPLHAQLVNAQAQKGYVLPDPAYVDALSALGPVSAIVPTQTLFGGVQYVTWAILKQADDAHCAEPSRNAPWPAAWVGTDSCGGGLGAWTIPHTEAAYADMRAWMIANLDSGQIETAVVFQAVGTQRTALRWVCVYQIRQLFCTIH